MFSGENAGSSPAGGFTVKIYLSPKRTIGRSSTLIATKSVSSLSAGSSVTIKARGTKGNKHKYIVAVVDTADVVSEDDEANNTVAAALPRARFTRRRAADRPKPRSATAWHRESSACSAAENDGEGLGARD